MFIKLIAFQPRFLIEGRNKPEFDTAEPIQRDNMFAQIHQYFWHPIAPETF